MIKDKVTKNYYVEEDKPYFFAFNRYEKALDFCNKHKNADIDIYYIDTKEDDEFLVHTLYRKGFLGGYFNGQLSLYNTSTHSELEGIMQTESALLNLTLFRNDKNHKENHLSSEVFYFFAKINKDGYLLLADIEGYILAFTDLDNMQAQLIRTLYKKGFEVIKFRLDKKRRYLINYQYPTQTFLEENFKFLQKKF